MKSGTYWFELSTPLWGAKAMPPSTKADFYNEIVSLLHNKIPRDNSNVVFHSILDITKYIEYQYGIVSDDHLRNDFL